MSYLLYGDPGSGSTVVELALAEIGADVDVRSVPLESDAQRRDEYAAVNAQRKLPTLVTPDGETLTESSAILLTLAERHPEADLLPPVPSPERAQALRWLLFIATELYPVIEIKDYPERFQPDGDSLTTARREELIEHARGIWKRRWLLVEQAVAGDPWFLESGFSLVDIYAAVVSRWAQIDAWRRDHLPRVDAIAAAVSARPKCAAVWKRNFG